MSKITWNEENTAKLQSAIEGASLPISRELVDQIAADFDTTARSISGKLRNLGVDVQKVADKGSAWTEAQEAELKSVVESNPGKYTYAELEQVLANGFTARQIQGKALSMELYGSVRKADPKQTQKDYSDAEEAEFVKMCGQGATIEDLATAFGRAPASIRGKALSLLRSNHISGMPTQATSNAKEVKDALEGLDHENMTIAEIAEASGATERGIKSMLTRRGLKASNYDGEAKRAKLDAAKD